MDQRIDTRDIITIPNLLSFFRIVLAGVFALVFYHARSGMRLYWATDGFRGRKDRPALSHGFRTGEGAGSDCR